MAESNASNPNPKAKNRQSVAIAFLVIGIIIGGGLVWLYMSQQDSETTSVTADDDGDSVVVTNFQECVDAGYPVMESYPRQCLTPEGKTFIEELTGPVKFTSEKGAPIELNDFQSGEEIKSPLLLKGRVPGSWSFEAVFPVVLTNWDGLIIAEGQAQLQGDWMTDALVPFQATLEFDTPTDKNTGFLILKKDNPSELPENDDSLEIPVLFE